MSIFTKIINREIPAEIIHEQDDIIVIKDINPEAKTHLLIIPKKEIETINDIEEDDRILISEMFFVAKEIAKNLGINDNYMLKFNVGSQAQDVMHIHLHLTSNA